MVGQCLKNYQKMVLNWVNNEINEEFIKKLR